MVDSYISTRLALIRLAVSEQKARGPWRAAWEPINLVIVQSSRSCTCIHSLSTLGVGGGGGCKFSSFRSMGNSLSDTGWF